MPGLPVRGCVEAMSRKIVHGLPFTSRSVYPWSVDVRRGAAAKPQRIARASRYWPRVHFMQNALAHVGPSQLPMVAAAIRTAFTQETAAAAYQEWRAVADRLRKRFRKLAD
jgi:hypothetical protein